MGFFQQPAKALLNSKEDKTMLRSATHLHGFTLRAIDGEIGKVDHLYFDDESWAIRYLVVNTGTWLDDRLVLISPFAIGQTDLASKQLEVRLTKSRSRIAPTSIHISPSPGSTRPITWGITDTPFIGRDLISGVL
jgi:hypothetical protein